MRKLFFLSLLSILLFACKSKRTKNSVLSPSNLKSQFFSIDPSKDTLLRASHGVMVKIPAGAIKATEGQSVEIEIKEVLTATEIIQSGLITESNGKSLKSSGMVYINATVDNKRAELLKPLPVSMHSQDYDPSMKIFKGEMTTDSIINWVSPSSPDTTIPAKLIEEGKAIFIGKCASCHNIFKNMTGPALSGLEKKGPWAVRKNIYSYIHNPIAFMSKSKYAQSLKNMYGSMMTAFPDLDNSAIDAILLYIKSEESKSKTQLDLPDIKTDTSGRNPCGYDTIINTIEEIPDYMQGSKADTMKKKFEEYDSADISNDIQEEFTDTTTFTMPQLAEEYKQNIYQFEISSFGWYNVDAFIEDYPGLVDIKISGEIIDKNSNETMSIYLFCPAKKFSQYAINQEGLKFDFDKNPGGLPFFLNERVILFAVSTNKEVARYGIKEFVTSKEQIINLEIKECSEKELLDKIKSIKLEGIVLKEIKKEVIISPIPCDELPKQIAPIARDTLITVKAK